MEAAIGLELLVATVGGIALTVGGLFMEFFAVNQLLGGELITGGWMIAVGAIALIGGTHLIGDRWLGGLRELRD